MGWKNWIRYKEDDKRKKIIEFDSFSLADNKKYWCNPVWPSWQCGINKLYLNISKELLTVQTMENIFTDYNIHEEVMNDLPDPAMVSIQINFFEFRKQWLCKNPFPKRITSNLKSS